MKLALKPDKYLELINRFPLRPIRSERENELAAEICNQLLDRFDALSVQEKDYLEVLSTLVEEFEAKWKEASHKLRAMAIINNLRPGDVLYFAERH